MVVQAIREGCLTMLGSRTVAAFLVTTLLASVGCTRSPAPDNPSTAPSHSVTTPMPTSSACRDSTASVSTNRPTGAGSSEWGVVGPLSFHPYPYSPGYPTKVLIRVIAPHSHDLVVTGERCTDGRPLRMWYDKGPLPGTVPLSEEQLQQTGLLSVRLRSITPGQDHTGAMLFSSTGKWAITITQDNSTLGTLLIDVTPSVVEDTPQS